MSDTEEDQAELQQRFKLYVNECKTNSRRCNYDKALNAVERVSLIPYENHLFCLNIICFTCNVIILGKVSEIYIFPH